MLAALSEITEREQEILTLIQRGIDSPSQIAIELEISQPGASQALSKLAEKGYVVRRKMGRIVRYQQVDKSPSLFLGDCMTDAFKCPCS